MVKRAFVLSLMAIGISGCSQSILDAHDARCPFTERGGCQSMEMVNRMVVEKRFTPDGQFVQQAPFASINSKSQMRYQK